MRIFGLLFSVIFALPAYADLQLASFSPAVDETNETESSPVLIMESPYSYDKTVSNLLKAINGKNYRLIRTQKVDQGYADINNESKDLIVYFCNFSLVNKAVKKDNRIGQFLPCRITVIERDGKIYLMAMNPKSIGNLLSNTALKKTCDSVTEMYMDIMDEVTI